MFSSLTLLWIVIKTHLRSQVVHHASWRMARNAHTRSVARVQASSRPFYFSQPSQHNPRLSSRSFISRNVFLKLIGYRQPHPRVGEQRRSIRLPTAAVVEDIFRLSRRILWDPRGFFPMPIANTSSCFVGVWTRGFVALFFYILTWMDEEEQNKS